MAEERTFPKRVTPAFPTNPEPVTEALLQRAAKHVGTDLLDVHKYQDMLLDIKVGKFDGKKMSVAELAALVGHPETKDVVTPGNGKKGSKPGAPSGRK